LSTIVGENRSRELLLAWLHLAVLWAFGFAQPLFEVLADSPEFFVARGNTRADIIILALGVTVLPPTALAGVELLLVRVERARRLLHALFVGALVAAIALQALKDSSAGSSAVLIAGAAALGLGFVVAYVRTRVAPMILTVLSPAPLVLLVAFVVFSPVGKLVLPQGDEGEAAAEVRGDTPVVLVVFDELSVASLLDSRHRIDERRFPNFAELARGSTWYRNATTVADETTEAVPAILTGQVVRDEDALPIVSDHPRNLFTLLGSDYSFHVEESVTRLCPERLCERSAERGSLGERLESLVSDLSVVSLHLLLPDDLRSDLPAVDQTFSDFRDDRPGDLRAGDARRDPRIKLTADKFEGRHRTVANFIDGLRPSPTRPTLHFLHSQLPHLPWEYLPLGQRYPGGKGTPGLFQDLWVKRPLFGRMALQRYLLQLAYVDRLLGRLLARLHATGLYDRSLLIVMSDHGVSFRPGRFRRLVTPDTIGDIAGIPLFVKMPGQREGVVHDGHARSVDVLPTIADQVGNRSRWSFDGRPLARLAPRARGPVTVARHDEGAVIVGFSRYGARLAEAARRIIDLFGTGDGVEGVFRGGRDGDLVGLAPAALPAAPSLSAGFELAEPALFASVDPDGPFVPSLVNGRLTGGASDGERLALAVNGRIGAVSESYRDGGRVLFGAMLPVGAFRPRRNDVEVYRVEGSGGGRRLAPYRGVRQARLARRGGREVVVLRSGREVPIFPDAIDGYVEGIDGRGTSLRVSGWAADTSRRRLPERVMVFADGRLLAAGAPSIARPDVARAHGRAVERSGYSLATTTAAAPALADPSRVRVFALLGDRASELKPTESLAGGGS
jgi:hypothetical protein